MTFGIGDLFDPFKILQGTTNLFGGPKPPAGAETWGPIEPPGAPPVEPADKTAMKMDAAKQLTSPPPGPVGLLHAGDDDFRPPPMPGGTGNLNLSKAGMENMSVPPGGLLADRPIGMAATTEPGKEGAFTVPSTGQQVPVGAPQQGPGQWTPEKNTPSGVGAAQPITTPSQSPQYKPTEPQPGESPKTLHPPSAVPAPAPAAKPGTTQGPGGVPTTTQRPGMTTLDKLGQLGQGLQQAGAGAGGGAKPGSPGLGSTSAAFTPNGSAIMQELLKMHPVVPAGPVPNLPPGILQRFKRGQG